MKQSIRAELQDLAQRTLGLDAPLPDGDLASHLDSMQRLQLVVAIEDHFEVMFDAEDDESIATVEDVVNLIAQKRTV